MSNEKQIWTRTLSSDFGSLKPVKKQATGFQSQPEFFKPEQGQ